MEKRITGNEYIISDGSFDRLLASEVSLGDDAEFGFLPKEEALEVLRSDRALSARLLMAAQKEIVYMGERSGHGGTFDGESGSLGMKRVRGSDVPLFSGDNLAGRFLADLAQTLRKEIEEGRGPKEDMVQESRVVSDWKRPGAERTDIIEKEEDEGRRFIHVDTYRMVRWRHDSDLSGATGHAQRSSDADVRFHTFECPFGTDRRRNKIRVDTAAQASLLYEKAIRGELDWTKMLRDMRDEGRLNTMSDHQISDAAMDYRAQFEWMREQITTRSEELSHLPIVASSLFVEDQSMGRSVYDAAHAPSPAHVLEHYLNNPHLLSGVSESYVERALGSDELSEPRRLKVSGGAEGGVVTVVVAGSDTIGHRVPGTRVTDSGVRTFSRDDRTGAMTEKDRTRTKKSELKTEEEVEADYRAMSSRLDSILSEVAPGVKVRFVTGGHEGSPKLVERYVKEHGGDVCGWDMAEGRIKVRGRKSGDGRLESVAMNVNDFNACWGVIVGYEDSVQLEKNSFRDSVVFRSDSGLRADAAVVFSVSDDQYSRGLVEKGSLAVAAGLPVIHVMDNMTEEEQLQSLKAGVRLTLEDEAMVEDLGESIFKGEVQGRWDLASSVVTSGNLDGLDLPLVMQRNEVSVRVGGIPYATVFGAYAALLAQEGGMGDPAVLRRIAGADAVSSSQERLIALLGVHADVSGKTDSSAEERAMRKAVHLFARTDGRFEEMLAGIAGKTVVEKCGIQAGRLFTDAEGLGQNRFGVVLSHEASQVKVHRDEVRRREEEKMREAMDEEVRQQKARTAKRAEGQLVKGGLPVLADSGSAVWFTGTAKPLDLMPESETLCIWEREGRNGKDDPMNREMVQRQYLTDGDGDSFPNPYVYIAGTNLLYARSRKTPSFRASVRDVTGCTRIDPATGKEFVCGFGIPTKKDYKSYEPNNAYGEPCSFRLDDEVSALRNSVILTDTQARMTALQHNMLGICIEGHEEKDGKQTFSLPYVFQDRIYGLPKDDGILRDPLTGERVYLEDTAEVSFATGHQAVIHRKSDDDAIVRAIENQEQIVKERKKKWMDSPHRAPLNRELMEHYIEILQNGARLPLNCFPLRMDEYVIPSGASVEEAALVEKTFVQDLNMSFDMANSLAVAMGVPLRFPLGPDGKIDLGPNVDERLRAIAQRKVEAFLGIRNAKSLDGDLPRVDRVKMYRVPQKSVFPSGDMYMKPNDLVYAFGAYDFESVRTAMPVPMHEMAFVFEDGSRLRLTDSNITKNMNQKDVKGYLDYSKNDEVKFRMESSDPDKADWQESVIRAYVERAKSLRPHHDVFEEDTAETRDLGMEGYIDLKSSNSIEHAVNGWEVEGREQKPWETAGRFNGIDEGQVYYGHVDAGDSFKGYAMMRYDRPDGTQSQWKVITDRELAKHVLFTDVTRVYRTDEFVPASKHVIDMMLTAEAVKDMGAAFRSMDFHPEQSKPEQNKVVEIERTVPIAEKVNVYAGRDEHARLSNFAERRFKVDMNKFTKRHGIK